MAEYKTETRIDSKGQPYDVRIAADSLNENQTPINLPNTPILTPVNPVNNIIPNEQETEMPSYLKDMLGNMSLPESTSDIYNQAYQETGIQQKTNKVNDLAAQLNAINSQAQVAGQTLESKASGKDVTTQFLGRQQQEINRQAAIQGLPVAASLQAAQGNLTAAQSHLDTLFNIRIQDATNKFNYNQKLIDTVYNIASKEQQAKLDILKEQRTREYDAQKTNNANAHEIAKSIMKYQPQLAAQIESIDWSKPEAGQKYQELISQAKEDPTVALDIALKQADIAYKQKQIDLLGEPTAAEKKAEADALKTSKGVIPVLQDKISLIDSIVGKDASYKMKLGEELRVGPNALSRKSPSLLGLANPVQYVAAISDSAGAGQAFSGAVHRLASKEFLDTLINAKSQGATFGSLTEREGDALRAAATQINDWEMKDDKGAGLGIWNVSQSDFNKELNRIKDLANKALGTNIENTMSADEKSTLDNIFNNKSPSNYFE